MAGRKSAAEKEDGHKPKLVHQADGHPGETPERQLSETADQDQKLLREIKNNKQESMTYCNRCKIKWNGFVRKCEECGGTDTEIKYEGTMEHFIHLEDLPELISKVREQARKDIIEKINKFLWSHNSPTVLCGCNFNSRFWKEWHKLKKEVGGK